MRANVLLFEHAAGTCRMGRLGDPHAVMTADGLLMGAHNIVVADASLIPVMPDVPINLTCMLLGWRFVESAARIANR